jgi:hypothetical protein
MLGDMCADLVKTNWGALESGLPLEQTGRFGPPAALPAGTQAVAAALFPVRRICALNGQLRQIVLG